MAITLHVSPAIVALSGNEMEFDFSTTQYAQSFIGIHCILMVHNGSTYVQVGSEKRIALDANHHAVFDPSVLLNWDPDKAFTFPENMFSLLVKNNNLRKQYYVTRMEKYGNPLTAYNTANTTASYALPGGISKIARGIINEDVTTWWARLQALHFFLSHSPSVKKTDPYAYERLFFFLYTSVANLFLRVLVTFTDGTTQTFTADTLSSAQYEVFEVNASFAALGLAYVDPDKTVKQYTVFLTSNTSHTLSQAISEGKTFLMEYDGNPNTRYFIFNNSYKMPEGIRFAGKGMQEDEYDAVIAGRPGDGGDETTDPHLLKILSFEKSTFRANSGWITTEEMILYRQFMVSRRVYWMVNHMCIPVIVRNSKIISHADNEHLFSIEIEYQMAHQDEFLSEDLLLSDLSEDDYGTGSDQVTGWSNLSFSTLIQSSGDITSAISMTGGRAESSMFTGIASGNIVVIIIHLTLNSGEAPSMHIYADPTYRNPVTTEVVLQTGSNVFVEKLVGSGGFYMALENDNAGNWSATVTVKSVNPEYLKQVYREANS